MDYKDSNSWKPSWKGSGTNKASNKAVNKFAASIGDGQGGNPVCEVHGVEMKERDGKYGKFYSHARKNEQTEEWEYCNGKGFNK